MDGLFSLCKCDCWEPSRCLDVSMFGLFLQGDDSLSAVTFDSDFETVSMMVSVIGRPLCPEAGDFSYTRNSRVCGGALLPWLC